MASQADVKEISGEGSVSRKRKFDSGDWDHIAEWATDEFERRKNARSDREKCWKEVDRQLAMTPDLQFKKLPDGRPDTNKTWMAETEMPFQAQALEILTADARRLMFPGKGLFFTAHAEATDEYLNKVDFKSIILGDELEVPSQITQDNADKLVEGYVAYLLRQTDFQTRIDKINAGAFAHGMGVGRARKETKNIYVHEARGTSKETKRIPVLLPCSIKNVYLEDSPPSIHSSQILGETVIAEDNIKLVNLQIAANKGSTDPDDEDGGWMPANLKKIDADKDGFVKVIEVEGDVIVPRKTVRNIVIPGAILTVVIGAEGKGGKAGKSVVRFRFRKMPYSSYLFFPYHYECANEVYPTGPLMKGRPIQMMATDAANRLLDSAMLKLAPPVGYDRSDQEFAAAGGPAIAPYAKWQTTDKVTVHSELGGDPAAMLAMFTSASSLYAQLTGILPARIGAQTVSHTTAFAKDAELQRGAVRTVDYVNQVGEGPMIRWLDMCYQMGLEELKSKSVSFYIDTYGGFVEINRSFLPDRVTFDWIGAGGPSDALQKMQLKLNSITAAVKLDQLGMSVGKKSHMNTDAAQDAILRDGGWSDIDVITNHEALPDTSGKQGAAIAALQNLPQTKIA